MMKTRLKLFLGMTVLGLIVILLTATQGPAKKTYKVGYSIDTISSPYNAKAHKQMTAAWKKYPEVTFYATEAGGQSMKQVSDIEDLLSKGVDLLIVKPRDEKTLSATLSKAYKQGIKVVLLERVVKGNDYSAAIITDDIEAGRVSAEYMAKVLGGNGNVLVAEGTPGASSYLARTQSFVETMKKYPGIKILARQPTSAKRDEGKTLTENWLQAYGNKIDGIHSNADEITMGIIQAINQAGKSGKIKVTSITGLQEAVKAVQNGQIDQVATITNGVRKSVDISMKLLNGGQVPKLIVVPTTLINKSNADKFYNPNVYLVDEILNN